MLTGACFGVVWVCVCFWYFGLVCGSTVVLLHGLLVGAVVYFACAVLLVVRVLIYCLGGVDFSLLVALFCCYWLFVA